MTDSERFLITLRLVVLLLAASIIGSGCGSSNSPNVSLPPLQSSQSGSPTKRTPQDWHIGSAVYVVNKFPSGFIFVPEILEFLAHTSGNIVPFRKIIGPATKLTSIPQGMASDSAGYLYVAVPTKLFPPTAPAAIVVFAPFAHDNAPPARVISGNQTQLDNGFIGKIDVDANGYVYAAINGGPPFFHGGAVLVFPPGGMETSLRFGLSIPNKTPRRLAVSQ